MASSQQVIDRLAERWAKAVRRPVECALGRRPPPGRSYVCVRCKAPREFELDRAIARLIRAGAFNGKGMCPYQVITSHLVAGLSFGPEAFRARSIHQYQVDPMAEIKGALKRIRTAAGIFRNLPLRESSPLPAQDSASSNLFEAKSSLNQIKYFNLSDVETILIKNTDAHSWGLRLREWF